ncbi:unnamed protein product [Peniophora sp. CBMAI 1063]|nr:unnamed protein product [Peniophora sp. CBMAI 1063]
MSSSLPFSASGNVQIENIEEIVFAYGGLWLKGFLEEALMTATDPLSSLSTPDNWRCWLDPERYVFYLARTLHQLVSRVTEDQGPAKGGTGWGRKDTERGAGGG